MVDAKVRKSLHYSVLDGSFWAIMAGFGQSFFGAFTVFLNATNLQIGLQGSLPQAIGSASQLFSQKLLRIFKTRKRLVVTMVSLQALMHVPVALVFTMGEFRIWYLLLFLSGYWAFGNIASPVWSSWMGDLVPEERRGKYFGMRSKAVSLITFLTLLVAGWLLQSLGGKAAYTGFFVLFTIAFGARLGSVFFLARQYEPPMAPLPRREESFFEFVAGASRTNYGVFVLFLGLFNFAVLIASPFFMAYMLNDLRFSYWKITILLAVPILTKVLILPVWGKLADRHGARKVMFLTTMLIPIIPFLWIWSSRLSYLIVIEILSGFAWAGFELTSFNFMLDATEPKKRTAYISYANVFTGFCILAGALLGSYIARHNHLFWSQYHLVFFISFLARLAIPVLFVSRLREIRKVEEITYRELLVEAITTEPRMGTIYRIVTAPPNKLTETLQREAKKALDAIPHPDDLYLMKQLPKVEQQLHQRIERSKTLKRLPSLEEVYPLSEIPKMERILEKNIEETVEIAAGHVQESTKETRDALAWTKLQTKAAIANAHDMVRGSARRGKRRPARPRRAGIKRSK